MAGAAAAAVGVFAAFSAADARTAAGADCAREKAGGALARAAQDPGAAAGVAATADATTVSRSLLAIVARAGASALAASLAAAAIGAGVFNDEAGAAAPPLAETFAEGGGSRERRRGRRRAAPASAPLALHLLLLGEDVGPLLLGHAFPEERPEDAAGGPAPGAVGGHLAALALDAVHLDGDVVGLDDADHLERAAHEGLLGLAEVAAQIARGSGDVDARAVVVLHAGVLQRGRDDVVALEPGAGRRGLGGDVGGDVGEDGAELVAAAAGGDGGDRGLRGGSGGEAALDVRRAGGEARAGGGASVVGRAVAAQHLLDQIERGSDAVEVSRARRGASWGTVARVGSEGEFILKWYRRREGFARASRCGGREEVRTGGEVR